MATSRSDCSSWCAPSCTSLDVLRGARCSAQVRSVSPGWPRRGDTPQRSVPSSSAARRRMGKASGSTWARHVQGALVVSGMPVQVTSWRVRSAMRSLNRCSQLSWRRSASMPSPKRTPPSPSSLKGPHRSREHISGRKDRACCGLLAGSSRRGGCGADSLAANREP